MPGPYDKVVADFAPSHWYVTAFYVIAVIMVGLHLRHGLWSAFQTLGWGETGPLPRPAAVRRRRGGPARARLPVRTRHGDDRSREMTLYTEGKADQGRARSGRADRGGAGTSGASAAGWSTRRTGEAHGHRGRHRPGRRLGRRHARRAGLQRQVLLLPGQPPPRAQHRRAGRHQRGQELPQRRRQRPAPVLRHDQGRRLPVPRGQRPPTGRGQRRHHRPVRGAGRAVRPRVRRAAGQPLLRRRAGVAHVLRARADRPAAAARRVPGAGTPGRGGQVEMYARPEMLDLVVVDGGRAASSRATW